MTAATDLRSQTAGPARSPRSHSSGSCLQDEPVGAVESLRRNPLIYAQMRRNQNRQDIFVHPAVVGAEELTK